MQNNKLYGASPVANEEFYVFEAGSAEEFHSTINHSHYVSNPGRGSHGQNSAVSSGYSSVNQSCSSSAGTGSHRSRSPTPDQFETVKEEVRAEERYGSRLLDISDRRTQRFIDERIAVDVLHGVDRNSTSCFQGKDVEFMCIIFSVLTLVFSIPIEHDVKCC